MATVNEIDKAVKEWERSLIMAALEIRKAEELVLIFPDDPGLKTLRETAWKEYRNVRFGKVRQIRF